MAAALRAARRLLGEGDTQLKSCQERALAKAVRKQILKRKQQLRLADTNIYCRPGGTGAGSLLLVGMMDVETLRFTLEKLG